MRLQKCKEFTNNRDLVVIFLAWLILVHNTGLLDSLYYCMIFFFLFFFFNHENLKQAAYNDKQGKS